MRNQSEQEQEKVFRFVRRKKGLIIGQEQEGEQEETLVPESELTHEQTAMLAVELWNAFMYMPGPVQDMFLARVDQEIKMYQSIRTKTSTNGASV